MSPQGGEHGASFADAFVGVELAAGLTGHQVSMADAATAAMAISLATDHGNVGQYQAYQTGTLGAALSASPSGGSGPEAPFVPDDPLTRQVTFPGVARDQTAVEVLFWPHTPCDPQAEVDRLAKHHGLLRFDPLSLYSFGDIDRTEPRILFGAPRLGPGGEQPPPNGWFPGLFGSTHLWREFFRVHPASLRWLLGGPDEFDTERTFLLVSGVTWHYRQTNDEETRVAFMIYAGKHVDGTGQWVPDWPMVTRCRQLAESMAAELQRYLEEHRVPPSTMEQRRCLAAQFQQPTADETPSSGQPAEDHHP